MDRRNFLKLAVSGTAAAALKGSLLQPRGLRAATAKAENFSVSMITDRPDVAIAKLETLFQLVASNGGPLTFEEFMLPGVQNGDIALVRNNALINFRQSSERFSQQLSQIARELELPREIKNPMLLKFSTPNPSPKASAINVYHRQTLVKQFAIHDQVEGEKIAGSQGGLHLTLNHGHAYVAAASCKHKTCMRLGSIYRPGQNLVCIPNELRIAVAGTDQLGIDGVAF